MYVVSIAAVGTGILVIVCGAILTAVVFRPPTPVERLKDALLSLALLHTGVCADALRMDYLNFDGTALPDVSCPNVDTAASACFYYITTPYDRAFSPRRSNIMSEKNTAIDRYLARNLATDADVRVFFHAFSDLLLVRGSQSLTYKQARANQPKDLLT